MKEFYSHFLPTTLGFVPEVVDKLVEECKLKGMFKEEWSSYVGILQDEVKVKDLINCATTGQLISYVNFDDTSNAILDLERESKGSSRDLATSALVVMVRGASLNLKFPLAAFATKSLNTTQLDTILWQTVELLEDVGLKVLFITCDRASQNRKFFELHPSARDDGEPVNAMPNPFADDDRLIYFISDAPHLLKTARNCFANSQSYQMSRMMWNDNQPILWTHIVKLFEEHIENKLYSKSKLTRAHIDFTVFSCMK